MNTPPQHSSPATDDTDYRRLAPPRTGALRRFQTQLRAAFLTWAKTARRSVTGSDRDTGAADADALPQPDIATTVAREAVSDAERLQVVSIDHIDPADLMRLDPSQLDHDPILKALVTGYQQGAARAEGDSPPEWKGGRS
jgi:hypothetical protein